MTDLSLAQAFVPYSRWAHRGLFYWLGSPKKAIQALDNVPVAVRIKASADPTLAERDWVVRFSHDRQRWGDRIGLTFENGSCIASPASRWRAVAKALWTMVERDPAITFEEVPVHIGDVCGPLLPPDVFAFARLRGTRRPLLPCPNLIRGKAHLPAATRWESKTDTLYFRGVDTGLPDLDRNARVALCRAAQAIPGADCHLSRVLQFTGAEAERLHLEGLVQHSLPLGEMNRHRFLVDCDGNSTSWDRYLHIGSFGGVPILFEPAWEECWHHLLVDGENCLVVDRRSLEGTMAKLRAEPDLARRVAGNASRLVQEQLGPAGVQAIFEGAWRERLA